MPNNVLLTPKVMARLVLFDLGGRLNVCANMSGALTDEFAKKAMKIGDTVQVRKPYRFIGGDGLAFDPEALVDQVSPVTVNNVPHVHFMWDSVEKTLDLREAMRLYAAPAGKAMAFKINAQGATFAANNACFSVGTPGTAPSSEATYLAAGDRLVEAGLPENEDLTLIVNRRMSSAFVSGVKTLFNPAGAIGKQWNKGVMQSSLGYDIVLDQTINSRTNGTFSVVGVVDGAQQAEGGNNATMSLLTKTWTTASLLVGDRFTIDGVYTVHPQTRISTSVLQSFVVTANVADAGGALTAVIYPAITPSGQYQNVSSSAGNNAVITMIGTTGQANISQGLLLHKDAFAFVSVPMSVPEDGMGAKVVQESDDDTGLNIRYAKYFAGDSSTERHRFDSLTGFGNLYREMACVIQSGPA